MGDLVIKEIDYKLAKDMIVTNHYSHKWNSGFGKINIGIFKKDNSDRCLGVASFGNMMHPKFYKNICEDIEQNQIIELNRMWIDDELGHNAESILISKSFKIIKHKYPEIKLIQSFADGRLGCGTIYKATNFRYYGYTKTKFLINKDTEEIYHEVLLNNTRRHKTFRETLRLLINNKLRPVQVKTYRYIYILDKKYIKKVKLKELPYPMYDKGMVDVEYKPSLNQMCKCLAYSVIDGDNIDKIKEYILSKYSEDEIEKGILNAYNNKFVKAYNDKSGDNSITIDELRASILK